MSTDLLDQLGQLAIAYKDISEAATHSYTKLNILDELENIIKEVVDKLKVPTKQLNPDDEIPF